MWSQSVQTRHSGVSAFGVRDGATLTLVRFPRLRNKVVADGAISGILDRPVRSRVTRHAFGTNICVVYDPSLPEHTRRGGKLTPIYSGEMAIPDAFSVILRKVTSFVGFLKRVLTFRI